MPAPPLYKNRNVVACGVTSFFTDIGSDMVYPLLPLFLTQVLGASRTTLGLIEGVAECLAQIFRVFAGAVSDRLGKRRPVAIGGYSASALGKVAMMAASVPAMVFAARVIDRFGKGIRSAPRDALIGDSVDPSIRGRAFGFHRTMDTAGSVLGIATAYILVTWAVTEIRTVIIISIIPAVLGVAALFFTRETKQGPGTPRPWPRPVAMWRTLPASLKKLLLVLGLFALGNSSNQFLLLRASELGFSESRVILLYLICIASSLVWMYPAGRLSDRIGRRTLLIAGYIVYALVYAGFAALDALPAEAARLLIWPLFAFYGLHLGLIEGAERAWIVDLAPEEWRATVLGLSSMVTGIMLLPASFLAGKLWDRISPGAAFGAGALLALAAAAAMISVRRPAGPPHATPA